MNMEAIDKWHKTKQGHLTFGLVELLLAYLFASLAIDSGSLMEYAVTLFFAGAIQNFVRIFRPPKMSVNEDKQKRLEQIKADILVKISARIWPSRPRTL
jgi:hypothetical protein